MRKKIGKRIGPVPIALVAVFALAAFISVGLLLAVPGGQTAEAQSLPSGTGTPDGTESCNIVIANGGDNHDGATVQGGKCTTNSDDLAVNIVNKSGMSADAAVYVTGGSKFRKVQGSNTPESTVAETVDDADKIGKRGVDEYLLSVAPSNISGDGKETVTVSRGMADGEGKVYLFIFDDELELDGSSTSLNGTAMTAVVAQFVGAPVAKADHDDNNATDQVVTSALVITDDAYIETTDGDAKNVIEIMDSDDDDDVVDGGISLAVNEQGNLPSIETSVWVTAEFRDANLKPVTGVIEFALGTPSAGAEGVRFGSGGTTRIEYGAYQAGYQVTKLPEGKDVESFKIPVMATITSAGNTLTVTANIVREGDAVMVEATAYACEIVTSGEKADTDADVGTPDGIQEDEACSYEIGRLTNDKASDDPDEIGALAGEDLFFISAKATDTAGNVVANAAAKSPDAAEDISSWEVTASADNVADAKTAIDGDVDENSTGVQASGTANKTIEIADDAKPGTYSITVTSPDGEVSTMIMVTVSDDASNLSITCDPEMIPIDTGLTDCTVTVTDENGNVPSNLHKKMDDADKIIKDTVRVAVRSKDVTLIGTDDNDVTLDDNGMASFSILLREDAAEGSRITVNVSSTIGTASLQASTIVMYGEAAPPMPMPMTLGDPSITSAMSDAAGMATIMLMPGDNADQHWIWALPTDLVSEGMYSDRVAGDATSFTMSGLTSGMSYWFTAVAGRDMEDGTQEWSMFSDWSAGTLIE